MLLYLQLGCLREKQTRSAFVTANAYFFDTTLHDFVYAPGYWPERKIWLKDSFAIESMSEISIASDSEGKRPVNEIGYVFIDLHTNSFYEYFSFSDTATFGRSLTRPDSLNPPNGWNFYHLKKLVPDTFTKLTDTVIANIAYSRIAFDLEWNGEKYPNIGYLRCDKADFIVRFDQTFSKNYGCSLVRVDDMSRKKGRNSNRINIVRENLTEEELKVFAAWEKNAKANPVQK